MPREDTLELKVKLKEVSQRLEPIEAHGNGWQRAPPKFGRTQAALASDPSLQHFGPDMSVILVLLYKSDVMRGQVRPKTFRALSS